MKDMKHFSHEEAEALIPKIQGVMQTALELKSQAEKKLKQFNRLEKNSKKTNPVELAIARSQTEFLVAQIKEQLEAVAKMGATPKGLNPCLVDFPARINGREVYLCWKYGEDRLSHYHGLEEGYSGRKPIPVEAFFQ